MRIEVHLEQGYLPDRYTKYSQTKQSDQPVISFPIILNDLPENTKYLAISLIDYDAVPRTGFPFIHWLVADIPVVNEISEDFSRQFKGPQGRNTWNSRFYEVNDDDLTSHYAGPTPPDKPHDYTLTIYALNKPTNLKNGFFYNEFRKKLQHKVIERAEIELTARN
ncbi:YbhB/YbcL family Raf kinase inhibitor-like protein [Lapidilactobacillus wuchangensis]|uniref:YbhB/YbcL family Raf kinase inhibitor-like protein n=1 Tax=Lapidilactobacillus wuchangensis TaxID=2486001 RepID=UPI000F7AD98A|nr:YbhB/YbcL family Raf kinase inhibitor-like protein [Lapidilactobacillus wuchangensis]